jgi:ribosomal-protein-alanine N-acetyltransferase
VADAKADRCFGMVNCHDSHMRNKRVTIGYIIDPALHQKGVATDAVSAMLD